MGGRVGELEYLNDVRYDHGDHNLERFKVNLVKVVHCVIQSIFLQFLLKRWVLFLAIREYPQSILYKEGMYH